MICCTRATVMAAATLLFAGCVSAQQTTPQFGSAIVPLPDAKLRSATPLDDCLGSGGVRVKPCLVKITRKKGPEVTVTGPGVYSTICSSNGSQCCRDVSYGDVCVPKQVDLTRYVIDPGEDCGQVYLYFAAYKKSGDYIGEGTLSVYNYFGKGSRCKDR